jgi:RNA polymerase sigma factor (sigma-70 family)
MSVTDGVIGMAAAERVAGDAAEPRLGDLFEAHHRRLYRLARRLVSCADEARDLVQDTFLRAARAPHRVPCGMPSEEAWLVRVLVNLCRDRWRKRAVQQRLQTRLVATDADRVIPDAEGALVAHTLIWRALRELSPRRRAVIVLYELEGSSVADIAALLGIAAVPLFTLTTSASLMWAGAVVMGICGIGIWGMAPTYLTERFPTIVRGVGPGLAYHAGAAIGSVTPTFIGYLQQRGMSLGDAMALVIATAGITVATVIWFGPETKGRVFTFD